MKTGFPGTPPYPITGIGRVMAPLSKQKSCLDKVSQNGSVFWGSIERKPGFLVANGDKLNNYQKDLTFYSRPCFAGNLVCQRIPNI
jgi:hypothetical protein